MSTRECTLIFSGQTAPFLLFKLLLVHDPGHLFKDSVLVYNFHFTLARRSLIAFKLFREAARSLNNSTFPPSMHPRLSYLTMLTASHYDTTIVHLFCSTRHTSKGIEQDAIAFPHPFWIASREFSHDKIRQPVRTEPDQPAQPECWYSAHICHDVACM